MKTKTGIVTSAKMKGTVTVTVHAFIFHPIYKKRFRKSKKFLADANGHDVQEGDTVLITECRPLSKRKRFQVTEVLQRGPRVSDLQEEAALEKAVHRERKHAEAENEQSSASPQPSAQ